MKSHSIWGGFAVSLALSFAILTSSSQIASAQDEPVVRIESTLVVLNAVVEDRQGRHVAGLTQKEFTVLEDSVEQPISFFAAEQTSFAAVLLIDTSGSMEERVTLARSAAIRFLDALRPQDSAAIYAFDSKVSRVRGFSNSRDVAEKIFDLKADGMTVLNDAIFEAAAQLSRRPEKRRAIIVLSDGRDTISKKSEEKALRAALDAQALIYTIDMSSPQASPGERARNQMVLKNFSSRTGGTFVATPGGVAMREAFRNIADELGLQYTLGYEPAPAKKDGKWHDLELRVSRPNLKIRTRKGYIAGK